MSKFNALDKFLLHGKELIEWLDGGSALHLNLDEALTQTGYRTMLDIAAKNRLQTTSALTWKSLSATPATT